jgi:hypothetical protein
MKTNMTKLSLSSFLVFLFLVNSCGTNMEKQKQEVMSTEASADLMKTFEVGNKQTNDFQESETIDVKKVAPGATVVDSESIKIPDVDKKVEKEKKKKEKEKTKKEEKKPAIEAASTAESAAAPVDKGPVYPVDYPEEYKGYDLKSKNVWERFTPKFYSGEQSVMAITYMGVTAGYITITSKGLAKIKDKTVYHYYARFKSNDAFRYFYWLDDYIESYVEKDSFLPLKYQLVQREKKQNVDDLQLFDFDKMMTYHWFKKVKDGETKNEKIEKPLPRYAQDSFSALQFVRGLPLNKGDTYEVPVVTRGKIWMLKVEVDGLETTSVSGKNIKAIKIRAETSFPGVLKQSGYIIFWYGPDADRKLLKFQAKVKIGSIYGELVDYKPGVLVK